jgi:hypothetical protein
MYQNSLYDFAEQHLLRENPASRIARLGQYVGLPPCIPQPVVEPVQQATAPEDTADSGINMAKTCSWPAPNRTDKLGILLSAVHRSRRSGISLDLVHDSVGGRKPADSHNANGGL